MAIRAVKHSWGGGKGVWYELNRAESSRIRPWVRDGDKNDSRVRRKRERRPAGRVRDRGEGEPPERRLTPLPIAGRTWACTRAGRLCGLFPPRSQEDRRLPHFQSHLVQGQQHPGSSASAVFPADKQDYRIRACDLKHSFILVKAGHAGILSSSRRDGIPVCGVRGSAFLILAACGRMIRRR